MLRTLANFADGILEYIESAWLLLVALLVVLVVLVLVLELVVFNGFGSTISNSAGISTSVVRLG